MNNSHLEISAVLFPEAQVRGAGQTAWGMKSVVPIDLDAVTLVPREVVEAHNALPVSQQGRVLLVAMANPGDKATVQTFARHSGLRIRPVQADAEEIRETLRRVYEEHAPPAPPPKTPLGQLLVERRHITSAQLEEALKVQKQSGERLGRVLVTLGYINRLVLAEVLAEQWQLPLVNLRKNIPAFEIVRLLDPDIAWRLQAVPVRRIGSQLQVAMADPSDLEAQVQLRQTLQQPLTFAVASELDVDWLLDKAYRSTYVEESVAGLLYRSPDESAFETFSNMQLAALLAIVVLSVVGLVVAPRPFLVGVNFIVSAFYLAVSLYRLWLTYRGAHVNLAINVSEEEVKALHDAELPIYTILIPLYKEKELLPDIVRSIDALDYPKAKLDVKLLLEESDPDTYHAAVAARPPRYFQFVIVPDAPPRTKPKACNYGLVSARGQYVVIYDAEDRPQAQQLKRAVAAFRRAPRDVICLQAKLNYYNRDQNVLTRWFTSEYSTWFDLILPGLDNTQAPIPLGGTSNHFVTEKLRELGAWDPYNVTEDADLGIRMFKHGFRTAIVDSTTYEEATSEVRNWVRQRSRWVKGYMQTWLVHMRHPLGLLLSMGAKAYASFHLTVGGTPAVFLLNPIYWGITTLWFLTHWNVIPPLFPGPVYLLAAFNLIVGNFVFIYMNLIGSFRREYYSLSRWALLSPIYWGLMSLAAWRAFWQLLTQPHHWDKTIHGIHTKPKRRRYLDPRFSQAQDTPQA